MLCCAVLDANFLCPLPCRGGAFAAGLLFQSHGAEADGGTALLYNWEHNRLEAIFNVRPNW